MAQTVLILQLAFKAVHSPGPHSQHPFAKEIIFSNWVLRNSGAHSAHGQLHTLTHLIPEKMRIMLLFGSPIPSSLTQVDLPSSTTLSASATHSVRPWPFYFSNTKVRCSVLFPAELQQGHWSHGGVWSVIPRPLLSEMIILFRCVFVGSGLKHHTSNSMCDVHHTVLLGEE